MRPPSFLDLEATQSRYSHMYCNYIQEERQKGVVVCNLTGNKINIPGDVNFPELCTLAVGVAV